MRIKGAVLNRVGESRPYNQSKPLSVLDLELDEPKPEEILVRMEAAGICHSDLAVVEGVRVRPVPMLLGHEASGRVEKVGSAVNDLQVGQRVIMTFSPRCNDCVGCRSMGRTNCVYGGKANGVGELLSGGIRIHDGNKDIFHHLGVSGFATHAVVHRSSVVPVEDDVPPAVAALLGCAVLTGGGALINVGELSENSKLVIVGLGGVGLAGLLTARAVGVQSITAIDVNDKKLDLAQKLGATEAMTPQVASERNIKADVVLEAAGNLRAIETAIAATAAGGMTILAGLTSPNVQLSISPLALVAEGRRIIGSYLGSSLPSRDIPYFVELWRAGKFPIELLVSGTISLEDINIGMEELASGEALRQIITF